MKSKIKTAVSLPQEYFVKIEAIRKHTHKSRSKIITEALQSWLELQKMDELESQYIEGYRRIPENKQELEIFSKVGMSGFKKEKW